MLRAIVYYVPPRGISPWARAGARTAAETARKPLVNRQHSSRGWARTGAQRAKIGTDEPGGRSLFHLADSGDYPRSDPQTARKPLANRAETGNPAVDADNIYMAGFP